MNLVIYFSMSKLRQSEKIACSIEGDRFELKPVGKVWKWRPMQMFIYGFYTVNNKNVKYNIDDIDYDKYDKIYIVSPVWAGRVAQYMRKFLESKPFTNKKVVLVGSCEGGYKNYFASFNGILDDSNEVVEEIIYVKGVRK